MADKEMRIKVSVDNNQYVKAMQSMGKMQDGVTSKLSQSAKVLSGTTGAVEKSQKGILGMGKAWVSANTGLGTFTAGLTPMTAAISLGSQAVKIAGKYAIDAVKSYATFEGTLKQVQIVAGGTQADMDMLGDKAIEIGGKTSKGAQEVVEAMVDFAKLGFTATETADAMEGIVYAAEASGSAVDTTAQIVAAALNTWNLAASDSEHIADVLAETANKTAADMTDLGYTFQYAGASAQLGGASMEQLAAYTGIMADQGIRGSKAGTALRTAFTNLTSPTDKAAAALDELGIKLEDAEGKARPIPDVIADLQNAAQNMSKAEILDLSTILFGKTGAAGMSMVLQKTNQETDDLVKSLENSTGTAAKQAAKMRETMEGQLDQMGDSWDAIKLKIGKGITGKIALDGVKKVNDTLDWVSKAIDDFTKKSEKTAKMEGWFGKANDRITDMGKSLQLGTSESGKFAEALLKIDENARSFQTQDLISAMFGSDAQEQIDLVNRTFDELDTKAANFSFLSEDKIWELQSATGDIITTVQQTSAQVAVETAKMKADPKYTPSKAISSAVEEGLPTLQSALEAQLGVVKENNNSQLDAFTTFLNNSATVDAEAKSKAIAAQATHNANQEASIAENNAKILELYQNLGTMSVAERESALLQIESLTRQNNQRVIEDAEIQKDAIITALRAQADEHGRISNEQRSNAIKAADEQRDKTIEAAKQQYSESVTAIRQASEESIRLPGKTREQVIDDARTQMTETVKSAGTMRDDTVEAIEGIETKANSVDGKEITVKAKKSGFDTVMEAVRNLISIIPAGGVINLAVNATRTIIDKFTGNARGGLVTGAAGTRKASGGLVSGAGGYGIGSGSATYNPNMTAFGTGNQLGQRGISQGVTHNERGREAIIPIQNGTYMRPFARAIADELKASGAAGGGDIPEIIVPVYLDTTEIVRATSKKMTEQQQFDAKLTNRPKGKMNR